jgi:outer membrane protein assembly factor BamB
MICLALIAMFATFRWAAAEDWPQWRGPHFNGSSTEKDLPEKWNGPEDALWKYALPGPGASVPIVWKSYLFITADSKETNDLWAICLDARSGGLRWQVQAAGKGFFGRTGNNGASPSPVTDGRVVVFMFGTGELLAFTMDGKRLWARNLRKEYGRFHILWKYGASPLLYDGKLYVAVIHQYTAEHQEPGFPPPASYLLCLDPKTGRTGNIIGVT